MPKFDLLILDDFGLKPLSAEQSSDLYDLIALTHIKSSLIITTNRKIEKWIELGSICGIKFKQLYFL